MNHLFDTLHAISNPIQALTELETIWKQLNREDGVEMGMNFLLTKYVDILPLSETMYCCFRRTHTREAARCPCFSSEESS